MAWITTIESNGAEGSLKRKRKRGITRTEKVFNIFKLPSLEHEITRNWIYLYKMLMHSLGKLTRPHVDKSPLWCE